MWANELYWILQSLNDKWKTSSVPVSTSPNKTRELCNIGNGVQQTPKTISSSLPPHPTQTTHFTDETTKHLINLLCLGWASLELFLFLHCSPNFTNWFSHHNYWMNKYLVIHFTCTVLSSIKFCWLFSSLLFGTAMLLFMIKFIEVFPIFLQLPNKSALTYE